MKGALVSVGQRLREERVRMGKTIDQFAEVSGIHRNSVRAYEEGSRSANTALLLIFQDVGVDIGYVLSGQRGDGCLGVAETQLLSSFGKLSQREKQAVLSMIAGLAGEEPLYLDELIQTERSLHSVPLEFRPKPEDEK